MGALGTTGAKGFGSSNLGVTWGRRLKVDVHKTEATSDVWVISQHHHVPEGLLANVTKLSRRVISQRRDVKIQRREVPERGAN